MDWWQKCVAWEGIHEGDANDWFYHTRTHRCGCGDDRDNDPSTRFSRIFLPCFHIASALAVFALCRRSSSPAKPLAQGVGGGEADELSAVKPGEDQQGDSSGACQHAEEVPPPSAPKRERMWYIDYARIVCVAAVVTEHSGGEVYSERNVAWVQQWVLPYLYTMSGMSFMFSSGNIWAYELRLFVVLLVGTGANWVADVFTGRDWQNDFVNTVYQMAYVVVIASVSFVLAPLRDTLRWRSKDPAARATPWVLAWTVFWGALTAVLHVHVLAGWTLIPLEDASHLEGSGARAFVEQGAYVFATYTGMFFLCFLGAFLGGSGWVTWLLLLVMYVPRMAVPYSRGGHPVNADLFAFGMVIQKQPLQGKAELAQAIREYWPIVFAVMLLMTTPGVSGRCDLHPHYYGWERVRFYSIESVLIVLLVSGAMNTSDTKQITPWLGAWALYAYCFHVFWARLLPPPYGALFTYACAPLFYGLFAYLRSRKGRKGAEPAKDFDGVDSPPPQQVGASEGQATVFVPDEARPHIRSM